MGFAIEIKVIQQQKKWYLFAKLVATIDKNLSVVLQRKLAEGIANKSLSFVLTSQIFACGNPDLVFKM